MFAEFNKATVAVLGPSASVSAVGATSARTAAASNSQEDQATVLTTPSPEKKPHLKLFGHYRKTVTSHSDVSNSI